MTTISEGQLSTWTSPAFQNEEELAQSTERRIREAISSHPQLSQLGVNVYAKGSYKNNTNVRRDSDVDIAVEYTGAVYSQYGPNTNEEEIRNALGITPYSGPYRDAQGNAQIGTFKNEVGEALQAAFGAQAVSRHNKVFTVQGGSGELTADVVPCTTYRKYLSLNEIREGIRLLPDRAPDHWIVNFPKQHFENGVTKNNETGRAFKSVVRILKNLENTMVEAGTSPTVASFLIESLVYNCPLGCFQHPTWAQRVRSVLAHIWEDTKDPESEQRWLEVSRFKFLFHANQPWTREEARRFTHAAWQYVAKS